MELNSHLTEHNPGIENEDKEEAMNQLISTFGSLYKTNDEIPFRLPLNYLHCLIEKIEPFLIKKCCYGLLIQLWNEINNKNRIKSLLDLEEKEKKFKSCIETHKNPSIDEVQLKECLKFLAKHFDNYTDFNGSDWKKAKKEMDIRNCCWRKLLTPVNDRDLLYYNRKRKFQVKWNLSSCLKSHSQFLDQTQNIDFKIDPKLGLKDCCFENLRREWPIYIIDKETKYQLWIKYLYPNYFHSDSRYLPLWSAMSSSKTLSLGF